MTMTIRTTKEREAASVTLFEWETLGPAKCPYLLGRFLELSPAARRASEILRETRMLGLTELRHGLEIAATSHVGRIRIDGLTITVLPKIKGPSLLNLLRYAYGFRRLSIVSEAAHFVDDYGFEDLLISQLNAEARELWSRGLHRTYVSIKERLSAPRGRIDLNRIAFDCGRLTATVPCQHHPRVVDSLLNQVLVAGLRLASGLTGLVELQRECQTLVSLLEDGVSPLRLDRMVLERAARQMNRLTVAYAPALAIIQLLVEGQGIVLQGKTVPTPLPGFLFDMNAFFQSLLSRFLRENLLDYHVCDEHRLRGMMRYNSAFNPRRRQSPTPRPDYVVMKQGAVSSLLDAKYRDLWETTLPREMLYQLVVYAISQRQQPRSAILYPATDESAKEARIDVTDPLFGIHLGQVCLRPVLLSKIEHLVNDRTVRARRERAEYAELLAFGKCSSANG
jgi:5-methylcytosine-specific restriction enzyme subunit McrC